MFPREKYLITFEIGKHFLLNTISIVPAEIHVNDQLIIYDWISWIFSARQKTNKHNSNKLKTMHYEYERIVDFHAYTV